MAKGTRTPLTLEQARLVAKTAVVAFSTGEFHERVLAALGKEDPEGRFVPLSVADLISYLAKTSWPDAWPSAVQIDQLVAQMAREDLLSEMTTAGDGSPMFTRRYLPMGGLTRGQAQGDLWLTPLLGVPHLVDTVRGALIHLTGVNKDGDERGGTGLALSARHILTARHVVDDMTLHPHVTVEVDAPSDHDTRADPIEVKLRVVDQVRHPEHDLAVVIVDGAAADAELPHVPGLVTRDPAWSDTLHLLGYPPVPMSSAATLTVQSGEVVNPAVATYDGADLFLYSAIARPGNSGGPIFGRDGRLVGMVTRELTHESAPEMPGTPAPFYAGLPARVIRSALTDLDLVTLLTEETWE